MNHVLSCLRRCFFTMFCLGFELAFAPPVLAGETIIYDGDTSVLQDIQFGGTDYFSSLAPTGSSGGISNSLSGNTIIVYGDTPLRGGTVFGAVYGVSGSGIVDAAVSDNQVFINNGTIRGDIFGGFAHNMLGAASATGNSVTVDDGTLKEEVYGGYASSDFGATLARGNRIIVNGGELEKFSFGGFAQTSDRPATASNNLIIVNGGRLVQAASGGFAQSDNASASADNNSVTVHGGTSGMIYGGFAQSSSGPVTANGNSVTILGGTVDGDVVGGVVAPQSAGMSADASDNRVTIGGNAEVRFSEIYGGRCVTSPSNGTIRATHNYVTLTGTPKLNITALYGGDITSSGVSAPNWDAFTGNTLNVWNYHGSAVRSVQNFESFNFVFPATQSSPVLTVTGEARLNAADGTGRGSTITASTIGGTAPLPTGTSITLLQAGTLATPYFSQTQAAGRHGALLGYLWNLNTAGNALTATVGKVHVNPQAKVLAEGYLTGTALLNQSADLIAGQGMREACDAAKPGFGTFAALSGGWSRYNSGSHVDISGFSLLTGLSFGTAFSPGRLTLGAFFEYGNGSYDTYNSFGNAADVNGDGNIHHIGGGVLGRMDFVNTGPGHIYMETSLRAGHIHNEYGSSDLRDFFTGRSANYDAGSAYYGLHFGTGYLWNINKQASLDTYAKYFWTRQDGDTVTLSTGDRVAFRAVDSHRLRMGSRFSYAVNECVSPYIGAAWEYGFDGRVKAMTYGYDISKPDLRGGTGIGEFGLTLTPSRGLPLSFDLGGQGYAGTRRGLTGSLRIKLEF